MSPTVHIVGIGPGGDDRYLTKGARTALHEAELVIFPGTQIADSIRSLVRGELVWGRWFSDAEIRGWVRTAIGERKRVAWLCSGDPSFYSGEPGHFSSLSGNAAWLRAENVDFEVHPGVTSLQALLARMGMEHARPESGCPLAIYAPGRDPAHVARSRMEALAALGIPLALFLADRSLAEVVEIGTRHFGPGGRVVIGHRIGWPDERIIDSTLAEVLTITDGRDVPYHTLVLLGPWHG
ncbi:MAG: SAM-dependent methyltransferase [Myxococcota bacterium]